jgi:heptosyltransferase-2
MLMSNAAQDREGNTVVKSLPQMAEQSTEIQRQGLASLARILVIRLSSLGDIVLTTPILRLLRTYCPAAQIDFLTKTAYADLLSGHPCVDHVICFAAQQGLRQTLHTLRQTHYDVVLDLHRTLRSRLLTHGLRARQKLTYGKRTLRRALLVHLGWNTLRAMTPVPELYAAPLHRLGIMAPLPPEDIHVPQEALRAMRAYVQQAFPGRGIPPLLAVAPGARWPTKQWPVARFAAAAQELAQARQAAVVVLGNSDERTLSQALGQQLQAPVLNSAGQLSLLHTAALLQQCSLLLSNDSGLMHLATALRVPVVAVFGPTVQEFGFYPFQAPATVVSTALACRPCSTKGSRRCPRGHHQCMQQVTVPQVVAAAQTLWEGEPA